MMDDRMWKIMQRRLRYTYEDFAQSLNAALMMVYAANEMIYAGVDPNEIAFTLYFEKPYGS